MRKHYSKISIKNEFLLVSWLVCRFGVWSYSHIRMWLFCVYGFTRCVLPSLKDDVSRGRGRENFFTRYLSCSLDFFILHLLNHPVSKGGRIHWTSLGLVWRNISILYIILHWKRTQLLDISWPFFRGTSCVERGRINWTPLGLVWGNISISNLLSKSKRYR